MCTPAHRLSPGICNSLAVGLLLESCPFVVYTQQSNTIWNSWLLKFSVIYHSFAQNTSMASHLRIKATVLTMAYILDLFLYHTQPCSPSQTSYCSSRKWRPALGLVLAAASVWNHLSFDILTAFGFLSKYHLMREALTNQIHTPLPINSLFPYMPLFFGKHLMYSVFVFTCLFVF